MKIVAKATPAVPLSIRKAQGQSGELGLWVGPGELPRHLLACSQRQGLVRRDDTSLLKRTFLLALCWVRNRTLAHSSRNRVLVISTSATRQECKNQRKDLMGTVKVFKRALVPIRHHTRNWDQLELGWSRHHFLVHGRSTMSNPWLQGAAKWSQTTAQWMES
jgi:hypothetical protein